MFRFNKALATVVFAGATLIAGGALAAPPANGSDAVVRVVVTYGDLDLGTAAGANTLRSRLDAAVAKVQGSVDVRDLNAMACRQRAHRKAMQMADAAIAAYRTQLAFAGPLELNVG
ncbi:MAG TPA: UrcA family protein [Caulobacteraceae bacterium]|jgi:UrcA family protein|nr:UrcA family protein [Caulobacteraceae bacterium]